MADLAKPLVINLAPVGGGGGVQNALSFLEQLAADSQTCEQAMVTARAGSPIERSCREHGLPTAVFDNGLAGRLAFGAGLSEVFSRGQTVFTLFGGPPWTTRGKCLNIAGCALSNLFYPEVWFWGAQPPLRRWRSELIDVYRRRWMERADYWIFETGVLARRAVELARFPAERVAVVRMACSALVDPSQVRPEAAADFEARLPAGFRLLFLCSAHRNKRLHCLPAIAVELARNGVGGVRFVLTLDEQSEYWHAIAREARSQGVEEAFCNLGPVGHTDVASLISRCGAMGTFSALESFSNNFVEAWRMGVPLLVSDRDWAREACGKGALYIEVEQAAGAAEAIARVAGEGAVREHLVQEGTRQLSTYPSPTAKYRSYLEQIRRARELGPCPERERRAITWPRIQRR